jgi:hypothetical protein
VPDPDMRDINYYSYELAIAARWILDHKDAAKWWNWSVLTAHNQAEDSLNLPDTIAWNVFTILESRGLIVPTIAHENGKNFSAFKLNLSDVNGWEKAKRLPSSWDTHLWGPLSRLGINIWVFIIWTLSLVIASLLTYSTQRLIDWMFPP